MTRSSGASRAISTCRASRRIPVRAGVGSSRPHPSRDGEVLADGNAGRSRPGRSRVSAGARAQSRSDDDPQAVRAARGGPRSRARRHGAADRARAHRRSGAPGRAGQRLPLLRPARCVASPRTRARSSSSPKIRTSVAHTWFLQADHARVASEQARGVPLHRRDLARGAGARDAGVPLLRELEYRNPTRMRDFIVAARTLLEGNAAESIAAVAATRRHRTFAIPKGSSTCRGTWPTWTRRSGARSARSVVTGGFFCFPGDGPRSVARLAAQETGVHETSAAGRGPASRGGRGL